MCTCASDFSMHCSMQVKFTDIGFRYPTRPDIVALEGVSLELAPGRLTAMVGLSGSGKSTMVALLQRLYDPLQGQVACCLCLAYVLGVCHHSITLSC